MVKVQPFRAFLRKFKRKERNEAARVDPASTTTTLQPTQDVRSELGDLGSASIAEEVRVGEEFNAAESHDVEEGPRARNTLQVVSKDKTGMFFFTNKIPSPEQTIDLVAIHGLSGHYHETWTDKNTNQNWLRDFLPERVPQLRIMSWGYNSEVLGSKSVGNVTTFAQGLLADLKTYRATKALEERPLIFICHSLGGLVFKRMLALAHERAKLYQATLQSIKGVLFLGTPHAGSDLASMLTWLAKIAKVASLGRTNSQLVEALKSQGDDLLEISESFVERGEQLEKIYSFFEQEKLYGSIVVTRGSARIGLSNEELVPMDCSHSTICKFSSPDNRQYERLVAKILELVKIINDTGESHSDIALQKGILESLEKYSYNPRRHSIADEYQSTFHWIWKSTKDNGPGFVDWLQYGSGLFWIAGKPGAGKSTLMKYILNHEQTSVFLRNKGDDIKKLIFCFFELGEPHEKVFLGFLHSLLYQLVQNFPALVPVILSIYREIQARNNEQNPYRLDWNQDDTRRALKAISNQSSVRGQVCLFIDGLDECDGGRMETDDIDYIVNLQSWEAISIRICISGRPELPIELRFNKFPRLLVQEWTSRDIAKYVSKELRTSFELAYHRATPTSYSAISTYLTDTLVQKAEGVFLWIKLVVKELKMGIESYVRDDDLKSSLESLPKGIDDLYGAIFAKISDEDLHYAIIYLETLSTSEQTITLHDMSFIEEGPQVALDRPFAAILIEERIERCHKQKGRIVKCTRNLLELKENRYSIKNGYLTVDYEDPAEVFSSDEDLDDEDSGDEDSNSANENSEDTNQNSTSDGAMTGDKSAKLVSNEGQLKESPGSPLTSSLVHESLLGMEVSFVHRTLQEYMRRPTVWEPIVQRVSKNKLIDPHLSMLACTLSKFKTSPANWTIRQDLAIRNNIDHINDYIMRSEGSNFTHPVFLQSMATVLKNRFPNWTEFWGLPEDWGCGLPCVLARVSFSLHLKEAFEQKRIEERHLPHLLSHYFMAIYPYDGIPWLETFQTLLQNGCRVVDPFLGRPAWEYLLWKMCFISNAYDIERELEVCRMCLENGANPNLVIQPITVDHLPLDLRYDSRKVAERWKMPCYPLHMILQLFSDYNNLSDILQTIKKFLEHGARLDVENADGETVLEIAAHRLFGGRHWNLAPILLWLQADCKFASRERIDTESGSVPRDMLQDLLDYLKQSNLLDESTEDVVRLKLETLLAKFEEKGYGYISTSRCIWCRGTASTDSLSVSDHTDDSSHVTAPNRERPTRPGSSSSNFGVGTSNG